MQELRQREPVTKRQTRLKDAAVVGLREEIAKQIGLKTHGEIVAKLRIVAGEISCVSVYTVPEIR